MRNYYVKLEVKASVVKVIGEKQELKIMNALRKLKHLVKDV